MTPPFRTKRVLIGCVVVPLLTAAGLEVGSRLLDRVRGEPWDAESGRLAIEDVCTKLAKSWAAPGAAGPGEITDPGSPQVDPVIVQPYTAWEHPRTQDAIVAGAAYYNRPASAEIYDICILGGSVAELFGMMGWKSLTESLHRDPRFQGRAVRVHNYALAGYKEPQQSAMLAYLFAMGHKPDAVVNIDGFNEAALGFHNASLGTHPLYPHVPHWIETGNNARADSNTIDHLYAVKSSQRSAQVFGEWFLASGLWRSCFLYHAGSIALERMRRRYVRAYMRFMDAILTGPKDRGISGPAFKKDKMALGKSIVTAWMECSTSLHAMCTQRGIAYLHVLQPTLHDQGSKPLTEKELETSKIDEDWLEGVQLLYPSFRKMIPQLEARGIRFFDASGIFRDHTEDVYYDLCHFAEHGNDILGAAIGTELARIDTRP